MDSTKRVAKANQEQEGRQVLSPSSSGRRSRSSASNSPEFEFWMVRNPSFPQPNLVSADELFVDGVLLPLHLLHPSNHHQHQHHHHHQRQQPDPPDPLPGPPTSLPDPEPEISPASITAAEPTTTNTSSLTSSKRWRDILFKKGEKKTGSASGTGKKNQEDKDRDKDREKKREKKCHSRGSSSAELNIINIWPFSRSRSAGNSGFRPRLFPAAGTRKASSAPCSRSNSAGESKSSRKWPSSPGRPGVHLGRSSPVWQVRRSGGSNSNVRSNGFQFNHHDPLLGVGGRSGEKGPGKKEATEPRRSKSSNSCGGGGGGSNNDGAGGGGSKVKAKALKMNVPPMCDGYRNQLSCGNEENSTIGVDGRSNRGGVKNGNTGRSGNNSNYLGNGNGNGGHIFNLRTLFSKKKGILMV